MRSYPYPDNCTLNVPGATLTYDVRGNDASTEPILLLIGSPMGAAGFGTLSQHFSDRDHAMAHRGAFAVAERLGTKPVMFPSNHGGSLGDEYGQPDKPEAFAAKLREVLAARA